MHWDKNLPAFHVLDHHRQHLAQPRVFDRVAHIAQPFDYRDPRAVHLLDVEAEVDEVLAPAAAAAGEPRLWRSTWLNVTRSSPMRRRRNSRSTSFTASTPPRTDRPFLSIALYS